MFGKLFGRKPNEAPAKRSEGASSTIEVSGFERVSEYAHMVPWLGRGDDASVFVPRDVEAELTRQQPGSRIVSIECAAEPDAVTKARGPEGETTVVVSELTLSFPLAIIAEAPDGTRWRLVVTQTYVASGLDGDQRRLRQDFTINSASQI